MIKQQDADKILFLVSEYEEVVRWNTKTKTQCGHVPTTMLESEKYARSWLKGFVQLLVTHD